MTPARSALEESAPRGNASVAWAARGAHAAYRQRPMVNASDEPMPGLFHSSRNHANPAAASSAPNDPGLRHQTASPKPIKAQPAPSRAIVSTAELPANQYPGSSRATPSVKTPRARPATESPATTALLMVRIVPPCARIANQGLPRSPAADPGSAVGMRSSPLRPTRSLAAAPAQGSPRSRADRDRAGPGCARGRGDLPSSKTPTRRAGGGQGVRRVCAALRETIVESGRTACTSS